MSQDTVRVPRQKRSMEKRDAILRASYELFCEKGYFKTNTAEIAKAAKVSTGIVYNYFHDKHDILKAVVTRYVADLEARFSHIPHTPGDDPRDLAERLLDALIASHTMAPAAHNEFMALALLDPEIQAIFSDFERGLTQRIGAALLAAGTPSYLLEEKLRISFGIIEQLCHDHIQGRLDEPGLARAKAVAVQTIIDLLKTNCQP